MVTEMKRQRKYLRRQIAALAVWAFSIVLMYATDRLYGKPIYRIALYVNAALFWSSFLVWLTVTGQLLWAGRGAPKQLPGIIRFFRNRTAAAADGALLLLLGGSAVSAGFEVKPAFGLLPFLQVAAFVFLVGLHSILNGSSYAAAYGEEEKRDE